MPVLRPTMQECYMAAAMVFAGRSECARRVQVGCIITNHQLTNVVAIGYNGPARTRPHTCDGLVGHCECVHAEANALLKAPYGNDYLTMFTTMSPCRRCATLILNSRVNLVYYHELYHDRSGVELLEQAGIQVLQELGP